MTSYTITSDDLVELIALSCAHALLQENDQRLRSDGRDDELLDKAGEILKRTGVRYPSKFWEKCGRALEAQLHANDPPLPNPEDPYLWESGT